MQSHKPVKVIDLNSNLRQIELGNAVIRANKKAFMSKPKLQTTMRRTSNLLKAE